VRERRTEPPTEGERSERLARAVEHLDMIDQRVAERCSPPVLQDVVGNLLLIVARLAQSDGAGDGPQADLLRECRGLALESLAIAGLPAAAIDAAASAAALVDGIAGVASAENR
jgi:hypothetical protein